MAFGWCQRKEGEEGRKEKKGKSERTNGRHQFLGDYTGGGREGKGKKNEGGRERENIPMLDPLGVRIKLPLFLVSLAYSAVWTFLLSRLALDFCIGSFVGP